MVFPSPTPQTPEGLKDWLPEEARRKRLLENRLIGLFGQWGYREVITPSFEYLSTLSAGNAPEAESRLFKLIDRHGRILALRPDMTTPIARLVGARLKGEPWPLRLCYAANVFRFEQTQAGRQREFYQAGVELLGVGGGMADAEVIALAVESLKACGLIGFKVGIGQVAVARGILSELALDAAAARELELAVFRKDMVSVEVLLERHGVAAGERRRITRLFSLHGGREALAEAIGQVGDTPAGVALAGLGDLWDGLEAYGVAEHVFLDLGILRDFDYYTGIVFEGYAAGMGFPVLGGGRYDRLLEGYGAAAPATGFALGIERVLMAAGNVEEKASPPDCLVGGGDLAWAMGRARDLRSRGMAVEVDLVGHTAAQLTEMARHRGIPMVVVPEEE